MNQYLKNKFLCVVCDCDQSHNYLYFVTWLITRDYNKPLQLYPFNIVINHAVPRNAKQRLNSERLYTKTPRLRVAHI
jgi:hypothetical protein